MEKVAFSITKLQGNEAIKLAKGRGAYLIGEDLLVPLNSKQGKAYIKVFEDVVKYCHPAVGSKDEFKGYYTEHFDGEDGKQITMQYIIWYKKDNA